MWAIIFNITYKMRVKVKHTMRQKEKRSVALPGLSPGFRSSGGQKIQGGVTRSK